MTFQSTLPEIDILPEGDDKEKSFLFQISNNKTPIKFQKEQTSIEEEQQPNVKRRLFQQRHTPFKDDEMILEKIEENHEQDEKNDQSSIQEEQQIPLQKVQQQVKPQCQAAIKGYEVYKDYNVMLNLTDISYGIKGHNKFYQIQLVTRNGEFYIYTKWGRTGAANPASDLKEVDSRFEGITQFKKKFRDKTHWDWDERDNFQQQQGKYQIVQVAGTGGQSSVNEEVERLNNRNTIILAKIKNIRSNLHPEIFDLMNQIWDIGRMNRTLKELNFDTERNPLGRLSTDAIQKGFKILNSIQTVLREGYKETLLIDLSNQFYTNIPQNFGMRKPPLIDNFEILSQKNHMLSVLQELDIANKYINLSISENHDENPLDSFYKLLKTEIQILEDLEIYSQIEKAIKQTHGPTHDQFKLQVQQIYQIDRKNEHIRYFPFTQMENRKLLWHGSRITNYVGILSEGLKIAPPEAPSTGYMFGKGVYFADVCSKSAAYCHCNQENPYGYVMLCEVALGSSYQVFKARDFIRPPQHYHSVHGVGRNHCNPKQRQQINGLILESGEVIPNEEIRTIESKLAYNEYVIYDVAQVRLKYLVKLKFIY